MKKQLNILLVVLVGLALLLAACGGGADEQAPTGGETGNGGAAEMLDRPETPAEYAGMTNPHEGDQAAIQAGQELFQAQCVSCHGETGQGDGPAAASLDPHPQNLAENVPGLSDGYLFWRISEGGAIPEFQSAMPSFKNVFTEDQIWQVISYIRTLGG